MGVTRSIDVKLKGNVEKSFFLSDLKAQNWSFDDYGMINYIKLNETDYDWTKLPLSFEPDMLKEISKKIEEYEDIGVVITYKNTFIGGQLIYFQKKNLVSFIININRKVIETTDKTDFEWYKVYYLKIFEKYEIESIKWGEP